MLVEITDRAYWLGRVNRAIDVVEGKRSQIDLDFKTKYEIEPKTYMRRIGFLTWTTVKYTFEDYLKLPAECNKWAHWYYPTDKYEESLNRLYSMRTGLLTESTGTIQFSEKEINVVKKFTQA